MAISARAVVVVLPMAPMRLVEKVPYITAPGHRVRAVVTNRCVMEKNEDGELTLTRLLPHPGLDRQEAVKKIREKCGWDLKVAPELVEIDPPTPEKLALLRTFDPRRAFIGDPG